MRTATAVCPCSVVEKTRDTRAGSSRPLWIKISVRSFSTQRPTGGRFATMTCAGYSSCAVVFPSNFTGDGAYALRTPLP